MLVDSLFTDHKNLLSFLQEHDEISFVSTLQSTMPKVVLLAGASFLEDAVQNIVVDFYEEITTSHPEAVAFVRNKAIKRQYHTYFEWDSGSANTFFGLFGSSCLKEYKSKLQEDPDLRIHMKDFCRLGSLRNQLVHGNYASFAMENTAEEIYDLYKSASKFVDMLPDLIRSSSNSQP